MGDSTARSRPVEHRPALLGLALLLCLGGTGLLPTTREARAAEPWAEAIEDGIMRQERERRDQRPEAILRRARLAAARRGDLTTRIVRLYLLARAYGIAGDPASSAATYREVLDLEPRCYFAMHDLAMLALQQQPPDRARAERLLRQAIATQPGWVVAQRKLALLLLEAGRPEDAVPVLRRVVDLAPADLQGRQLLATALLQTGRYADAEREIVQLRRQAPDDVRYALLEAELRYQQGRLDEAAALYRRLAVSTPGDPAPLQGYLRCLDARRERGEMPDAEEYLWALEGLLRLERDPERAKQLKEAIESISRQAARTERPEGPPTPEELASLLRGAPVEGRVQVLRYLFVQPEAPPPDVLRATMERLGPQTETDPTVRQWALRVLGRFGGWGLVGLVRHALADPDRAVRPVAVDALVALGEGGGPARGAVTIVLGRYVTSDDAALAAAAREGLASLHELVLDGDDAASRREAFLRWWQGPVGAERLIRGLARYPELGDPRAEEVILPYLDAGDPHVAQAAWRALATIAETAPADARGRWLAAIPPYEDGALHGDGADAARGRLAAWAARRPR